MAMDVIQELEGICRCRHEEAAEVGVGLGTAFPHRAPYEQCVVSRVPRVYGYVLAVSAALAAEPPVEGNRQVWIVCT